VVDALLVAAKAAPIDLVLKDRMKKNIDGKSFTGPGVTGDQPTSAKVVSFPFESADRRCRWAPFGERRGKTETERKTDEERQETEPANNGLKKPTNGEGEYPEG
jgi:hypothetical protein